MREKEGMRVREGVDKLGVQNCKNVAGQVDIPANSAHKYLLLPVVYLRFRCGLGHMDTTYTQQVRVNRQMSK